MNLRLTRVAIILFVVVSSILDTVWAVLKHQGSGWLAEYQIAVLIIASVARFLVRPSHSERTGHHASIRTLCLLGAINS